MASSAPKLKWAGLLIKGQIKPILGWAILRDNDIIGVFHGNNELASGLASCRGDTCPSIFPYKNNRKDTRIKRIALLGSRHCRLVHPTQLKCLPVLRSSSTKTAPPPPTSTSAPNPTTRSTPHTYLTSTSPLLLPTSQDFACSRYERRRPAPCPPSNTVVGFPRFNHCSSWSATASLWTPPFVSLLHGRPLASIN